MRTNAAVQQKVEEQAARPFTAEETRVGVVFVHGIGEQPESDAIREFGGALLDWLQRWHRARSLVLPVDESWLSYGEAATRPARFSLHLPRGGTHGAQTWVLAEAWWGARLHAPDFVTMTRWGLQVVGRVLGRLSRSADRNLYRPRLLERPILERLIRGVSAQFLLVGYAFAQVLAFPLIVVLFLIAQLPGPFERVVLNARLFVVQQLGDFYTSLHDDIQAVHIRNAVAYAVKYLVEEANCERIAVIAHSHGTVVAFDALSSGTIPEIDRVRTLITHGGALNNAWSLRPPYATRLGAELPTSVRWIDVWADYDPVSGGPIDRREGRRPDVSLQVNNGLNVITDHGGYARNREEFLSRVAQELDAPGAPKTSRFFPGDAADRIWRRRRGERIVALVSWRLVAMILFAALMLVRMRPFDRLAADGEAAWLWLARLPLVGGVIDLFDTAGEWLGAGPPLTDVLARLFGVGSWALVFAAFYLLLTWPLFAIWHEAEGKRSVQDGPPPESQRAQILVRSAIAIAGIGLFAKVASLMDALPRP